MGEKPVRDYDKFMLRFPDGMRDSIAERAKVNGRSMNSEIIQILEDALNGNTPSGDASLNGDVVTITKEKRDEMINVAMTETAHAVALKASKESANATAQEIMKRFTLIPKE